MALAELDPSDPEARQRFEDWVREHGTFNNYWFLARYYRDQSNTPAALEILNQALDELVIKRPEDMRLQGPDLLYDACNFAYENGHFELCRNLARQWEERGSTGEKSWLAFAAAAELKLGQFDSALNHATRIANIASHGSAGAANVDELLRAVRERDINYVYVAGDPGFNWVLFEEPMP